MFSGIVTEIGEIVAVERESAAARFAIACRFPADEIALGASIACAGPCLTVTEVAYSADGRTVFSVDASAETLKRTTLGAWERGTRVNLERSLKLGDELGGHLVTGHIDGMAEVTGRRDEAGSSRFDLTVSPGLARFIAEKGSIALDGTSLTVNGVSGAAFWVTVIPHTLEVTTWGARRTGDRVNLEVDLLARYVARLAEA